MKKRTSQKIDLFRSNAVENYIQTLRDFDLFDSVERRIKHKFDRNAVEFIQEVYDTDDISFHQLVYADLSYRHYESEDDFYGLMVKIFNAGFQGHLDHFEIVYTFNDRESQEYLGEFKVIGPLDTLSEDDLELFQRLDDEGDTTYKIKAVVKNQEFEYSWPLINHCAGLLRRMNAFNAAINIQEKWYPLPSGDSDLYIHTTAEHYKSLIAKHLIMPEKHVGDDYEYEVDYAHKI